MVKTENIPETQPETRRERRKEETRTQIFQAAMRLFERKGVFNTTVEEITASADVAKGTFFNYFPSKEAILTKLAERQVGVIKKAAEEAKNAPSMRPILISMAHDLAAGPGRSQMMLRSLLSVVLSTNLLSEIFQKNLELGRQSMATIMERGQNLGEIRTDLSPLELARIFQHAMFGTLAIWGVGGPSDLSTWIDKTFDVVWCGIAVQSGPRSAPSGKEKGL
jgi:AcrR family transcriptional regulator